jgi:putative membrane protein
MRHFFSRFFVSGLGLLLADAVLDGIRFDGAASLWIAALLLGVVNAIVRPLVILVTLPLTLLTLGVFLLVVNGAMLALVAWIMPGFSIETLGSAVMAWIIVGLTGLLANWLFGAGPRVEIHTVKR